ncbi:hypothetical protein EEL32_06805 [Brevibacillus laterosporus]|uniref:Uncharacterized protein n=1 Tax=Brevibacillus laterosporus TaxID=1465 RepID=A0A502IUP2_BRELA|nr:hypothetical protein [Brevibacillus laterosporus]QDX92977.1 hypothetical protein EEL30_12060 [Brevibacillus laterosporus]TPG89166.1 hypothetical protein EEL32_06805 [Brevibacillus laterosporus]
MNFWIQASCPKCTGIFDEEDENLSNAIETIFPMMTEKAIMVWKTIYIPLCYKYDISCMVDDILDILEKLRSNSSGEISLHWASNTFANVWNIRWWEAQVVINSEWGSVLGHTEQLLDSKGAIVLSKQSFISEWKRVLFNIISGLKESGYKEGNLPGMTRLIAEYNAIDGDGILYK